jgi:glutaredoxin
MTRLVWILLALALVGGLHHLLSATWTRVPGLDDDQIAAIRAASATRDAGDPQHQRSISVLRADWCGYCRKLQAEFDRKGVRYHAIDVDTEAGARAMMALKARGIPVLVVGRTPVHGYDETRTRELLAPLGHRVF